MPESTAGPFDLTIPLIPILPFLAFWVTLFWGKQVRHRAAVGAIVISTLLALSFPVRMLFSHGESFPLSGYFLWALVGSLRMPMGYYVDQLSAITLAMVTVVVTMIQIYSIGYMHGDKRYPLFFAYLSLFSAGMLGLVIADNILLFYACWEIMGLCSYLLIGFWYERSSAMRAAKKAFMVTRVGDVLFFFGWLMLFVNTGSIQFSEMFARLNQMTGDQLTVAALLLFGGAVGKSAQFPLHIWLPDAMEGPTPVSALIHAATMVAAGVFLVGRTYPVFSQADPLALLVVSAIGVFTALMAAVIGVLQNDIKRVLAYSTVSQLGYMMMALGIGGYTAGLFHLITHAFFKALLFLGSGSVIHGTGTQDMMQMGGLRHKMPYTFWTFMIGTLALAGIPPLAGFWSKDEILLSAFHSHSAAGPLVFYGGLIGAFLTAFYMTRLLILTFFGSPRDEHIHAHESPFVMTVPLMALAAMTVLIGLAILTGMFHFSHYVRFEGIEEHQFSLGMAALSSLVALAGIGAGILMYTRLSGLRYALVGIRPLYVLIKNKFYWDEVMYTVFVLPLFAVNRATFRFDQYVIDMLVNLVGWLTVQLSRMNELVDRYVVDGLVNLAGYLPKGLGYTVRYVQTGVVQTYLLIVFLGTLLIFGGIYMWLIR
ncbi:MAG: NADH-quinone oxidoreductase subunit L [Armatimonadetes bacterium]|nr:NADH-quinone oxidoreductase subunit L [Armatimonadota bacterium]